ITAIVVLLTVAFWATQSLHGIEAHVVALVGMVVLGCFGVLDKVVITKHINWSSLIFLGFTFSIADVFSKAGVNDLISNLCGPVFETLAQNPYLFIIGIGVVTYFLRFVIVSEIAYVNIVLPIILPLAVLSSINPWVVGVCIYTMLSPFFLAYQNPVYIICDSYTNGNMTTQTRAALMSFIYIFINIIALVIATFFWQMFGFFG
ncbi:MAG: anion permease, partial [Coriobacteriales bacterium]|nr:anion permease [Coriobacteriales bacterium]